MARMPSASSTLLAGRRALVTGGTRGIGAATARLLVDAGAQVLVSARTAPSDSPFPVITADMSDRDEVQALGDSALAQLGGIDVLVSNVGGQIRRPGAMQFNDDDWQQEIDLNLLAAVSSTGSWCPQCSPKAKAPLCTSAPAPPRSPAPPRCPTQPRRPHSTPTAKVWPASSAPTASESTSSPRGSSAPHASTS